MRPGMKHVALVGAALALLAGARTPARAQTPDSVRVRGRVVRIAGADLHIELLSRIELQAGDTLIVQRDGSERGRLHVLAADSARALAAFVAAPFALTRGEVLDAELRAVPRGATSTPTTAPARIPMPDEPAPRVRTPGPRMRTGARVSGYVAGETRWVQQRAGDTSDSYAIPAATISLRVTGLPNGTNVHVYGHAEHYGAAHAPTGFGATELRLYTARLETAAGPMRLALGRLTSSHDAASGTWDGVSISAGGAINVAAEAGYEPERAGAAPSTLFPRVGASAQAMMRSGALRYRGSVGAMHYLREVPVNRGSSALFTRHSVSARGFSLSGDARVETSDSGSAVLRWGGVFASLHARGGASAHVGYRRYTPFILSADTSAFAPRNRIEAGGHVPFGPAVLTVNASASPSAAERARSVSGRLAVQSLPGAVVVELEGGLWEYGVIRTTTAGGALSRMSGRIYTRAGYRYERSRGRIDLYAHELEGDVTLSLGRTSSMGVFVMHSAADEADGTRAQLRLTWGF